MCFDTTSSNTGRMNGACVLIEQGLKVEMLFLACRHHILELVVGAVFTTCLGVSASPEVLLFKRFKSCWKYINKNAFEDAKTDQNMAKSLGDINGDITDFIKTKLLEVQPRNDYRKLLELSLIVLGGIPIRGIRFTAPGAMHQARWMSKVIYSMKIWLFRSQFKLTTKELKGITEVVIFGIRVYLKAWMTAPLAISAPRNDLNLLKTLIKYEQVNPKVSKAAATKMANHMWYLSEDLVGLAFFDDHVATSTKCQMVQALKKDNCKDSTKRAQIDMQTVENVQLHDFVSKKSRDLFEKMDLPDAFLEVHPETWEDREDFKKSLRILKAMNVVNDHAERGVSLIQEYSNRITKNEDQLQFLLQVVQEHRRAFPDSKKCTLARN